MRTVSRGITRVYPIGLDLHEKRCVVIGGGTVAERRIGALFDCGAQVKVISPTLTPRLRRWVKADKLMRVARRYRRGDLKRAFLCIAATSDRAVNEQVWREGRANGVLMNSVDDAAHSDFIVPAILRRGGLSIAVSTNGASPGLAARIREELVKEFGREYSVMVEILRTFRPRLKAELASPQRRRFINAVFDSDVRLLLKNGRRGAARARVEEILEQCK